MSLALTADDLDNRLMDEYGCEMSAEAKGESADD
jgi:hypothetical protein